ncbi:tetratricopeptide repeat protein [Synechococcus sp. CS-1332]|uniref:tetratricopeptide repeat protein n=1 Tax=Synechococcus sp. CS-1332 TaxID=2847972 RepID=UPI00223B975E|nr:tetratricopeptide repeat protein [Synechococcus sp. CS-1332]MCT0207772.1 tetratricopeptide repeat protein [Synechococcus sp. CS-1332]
MSVVSSEPAWCIQEQLEIPVSLRERIQAASEQFEAENQADAVSILAELLEQNHATPEEWLSLAQAGIRLQQMDQARVACGFAITQGHLSARSWSLYGGLLYELGEAEEAEAAFRHALSMDPQSTSLIYRLGTFLLEQGRPDEAVDLYGDFFHHGVERSDSSGLGDIYASCGLAMIGMGKNEEALEVLLGLFSFDSEHKDFNYLMGLALKNLKEYEQAADFFRKSLPQRDHGVDTVITLADCLRQMDRPDLGAQEYEAAIKNFPHNPEHEVLSLNMAQMYFRLGDNDRARSIYDQVLSDDPGNVLASYLLLALLSTCGKPEVTRMKAVAAHMWRSFRGSQSTLIVMSSSHVPEAPSAGPSADACQDVIKIGILSSEIGDHVVGMFMTPLLENYDRDKFRIDLISCRDWSDPRSDYLCSLASASHRLAGLNDIEAREFIRQQQYDIILETSGYTHSASLFILAERCAPVQCHYIGFHATTGLDTIDYFIGDDELLSPELVRDFSEKPWRLPRPWMARSYSDGLPAACSRATHDGPVFGSFSSLQKLTDQTLCFWGEALQAVPGSLLILKDRLTVVPMLREKILKALACFGVDPDRVSFLGKTISWQEHMDAFNLIDIGFDTTPWSGATTAFDTLSMGVPLIGIRGNATSGRMSSSVLKAIGHADWISSTPQEFSRIAQRLAADHGRHRQGKKLLQDQVLASCLFDGAGLARELERSFTQMLSRVP